MEFDDFLIRLSRAYEQGLPGTEAQQVLAPASRPLLKDYSSLSSFNPRLSAVTVLLFPDTKNTPHIYLIKRNEYEGTHSGQVSFPGGKFDELLDDHLQATANRELDEELGINQAYVSMIGSLTELYIPVSNFLVKPYLAYLSNQPSLVPNSREVNEVIELPVSFLMQNNDQIIRKLPLYSGTQKINNVPQFNYNGQIIWGATAMILNEFREILHRIGK
jgi:8-oxo-dGTP pyrophosphatase MutT (NUDIX family)